MHVTHVNRIKWFMRFMWVEGLVEDGMLRDVQERAKKKFIYRCCRCQCPSLCDWFSIGYTELLIYIVVMVHGTPINRSKERRDWEVPLIQGHVCPLFKRYSWLIKIQITLYWYAAESNKFYANNADRADESHPGRIIWGLALWSQSGICFLHCTWGIRFRLMIYSRCTLCLSWYIPSNHKTSSF